MLDAGCWMLDVWVWVWEGLYTYDPVGDTYWLNGGNKKNSPPLLPGEGAGG
jgi:hypothetical protein